MSLTVTNTKVGQRYQDAFSRLTEQKKGAFVPFVMIGDPNAEQSFNIIKTLIDAGADALELGIPFSDPSADGETIQKAGLRAQSANVNTDVCIDILSKVRAYAPDIPMGLLLYGNLIFARGINKFYADMAQAGVDSILIADLPIRECQPFKDAAIANGIAPIFIAPPNASDDTLQKVAEYSHGYTYVLSRVGVTGVESPESLSGESKANIPADDLIAKLKEYNAPPAVLGFGISSPEQVSSALKTGASGAISGSAVVKIIENNLHDHQAMLNTLADFIQNMKAAT